MIARADPFIQELTSALGFDPKQVGSIRIDLQPNSAVVVTVVRYLTDEEGEHVLRLVGKYKLVLEEET